ncbi:hypothetical protein D3C87_78510 [compost metagenome]
MSRLRKIIADIDPTNEDMGLDEAYQETVAAIQNMQNRVNEWSVRDVIRKFTSWGFYGGQELASIDIEKSKEVLNKLSQYVEEIKNDESLFEVYDLIYKYAI